MRSFKLFKPAFKNLVSGGLLALSFICVPMVGVQAQGVPTMSSGQTPSGQTQRVPYDRALISKLPSTNDNIGIAFLKTANNFPDFGAVVEATDAYKNLNQLAQQDYKSKTVTKLQNDFLNFSPKKSDLIIRVKVNILFTKLPNGEGVLKIRTFPDDPVYFPFYFSKYPIALIVKDMEVFRELRLDKADTDIVYSRLSLSGDATLLLQLYALAADDTKTVTLDNIPQYPLLAEIGYIGLLNNRAEQIWAWRNPKLSGRNANNNADLKLLDVSPTNNSPAR